MLIDAWKTECQIMNKVKAADGLGGFTNTWTAGDKFMAAIVKDSSLEARVAEKEGVTELYTVTVDRNLNLEYHDVFKRLSDNAIFRVTSNEPDSQTPTVASFAFGQVTAERWELA